MTVDERRFDALARTWAARSTRRTALRRGIGGLAAGLGLAGLRSGGVVAQSATPGAVATPASPADAPIDHIVVIYLENHPFDNLYGFFPGANGLESPGALVPQDGKVYDQLPQPINTYPTSAPDTRFPSDLSNAPFPLDQYVALDEIVPSPVHRFYQHQLQMNGGKMDKFVAFTDSGGLVMGYHDTWELPLFDMATQYTPATTSSPPPSAARYSTTSGLSAPAPRHGRTPRRTSSPSRYSTPTANSWT